METNTSNTWKRARCIEDWCMVPKDYVELAIMANDEPGCEANIGRAVAVLDEKMRGEDGRYWVPIRPMGQRPWTLINDQGQVQEVAPRQVWVRLHDLLSTQCFAPQTMVPGMGPATGDERIDGLGIDESRWKCKPGDWVMVVDAPFHPFSFLPDDEKAQIGCVGVVLGKEEGGPGESGWHWAVAKVGGGCWTNTYSVGGVPYTLEEPVMLVNDARLLPLQWVPAVDDDEEA